MDEDLNKIMEVINISYFLKIVKLVIIILNFSYLLGIMWVVKCKFMEDVIYDADYRYEEDAQLHPDAFEVYYGLYNKTVYDSIIVYTYFAFTSLSTVGFGDYCPRSDFERAIGAFMLLFGVALFSYIMGNFIEILNIYKTF